MSDPIATASEAWGDMPDWVEHLAQACAETSQRQVANRLDRSPALLNQVLRNCYPGDMAAVEARVRSHLMSDVDCPALGKISWDACKDWRLKFLNPGTANPRRIQMFKACRDCPRNQEGGA